MKKLMVILSLLNLAILLTFLYYVHLRDANRVLHKSAERGNAESQSGLGLIYKYGLGVEQSYAEAFEWFRKAAEQGYAPAQWCLGMCYERGEGVEQNNAEAIFWYRKSAEQEFIPAQRHLEMKNEE